MLRPLVADTRSHLLAQCGCDATTIDPNKVTRRKRVSGRFRNCLGREIEEVEGVDGFDYPIRGRPVASRALILLECGVTMYS